MEGRKHSNEEETYGHKYLTRGWNNGESVTEEKCHNYDLRKAEGDKKIKKKEE